MSEQQSSEFPDSYSPAQTETPTVAGTVAPVPLPPQPEIIFPSPLETFASLMGIIVIALFLLTFVVQPFRIPSESMEKTLLVGDFLLVNKAIYGPNGHWGEVLPYQQVHRGDIVVFHFPLDPSDHVVKRVAGLPGDRIHLDHGQLFVNGAPVSEPYAVFEDISHDSFRDQFPAQIYTDPGVDTHWWMQMRKDVRNGELIVPQDSYFVLGDNRDHSRDSRYWGFVPMQNIVGRPFVIYFSLRRPSATEAMQDDRLGHGKVPAKDVVSFARWNRMFRVVR
ncbi:MAG TPA: signal peptidase I [Acidisarcina sp.]|nr:signal peptidase I [Acidisarcina sp.]